MLTRLRWSAFGLRGRIVGAVVATTAVTLGVAALVLLPQLEGALRKASMSTLVHEVKSARSDGDLTPISTIKYPLIQQNLEASSDKSLRDLARAQAGKLVSAEDALRLRFGASSVTLIGAINDGVGHVVNAPVTPGGPASTPPVSEEDLTDAMTAFGTQKPVYSFGTAPTGQEVVRAAIPIGKDAVVTVSKSIDEIPAAVNAVRRAFEIAAGAAILMTLLIAIPLAGTIVSRLQRLRQAALQLAIDGSGGAGFPVDRARDEVGDLARSFSIMQRRLRQQEEARRAFVATASHELRTPLASLDGMLELLADDLEADHLDLTDAAALLDRARAQSRRLGRLAADLLDLSRIDADVALRSELIELGELSRAVMAEFDLASVGRGVNTVLAENGSPAWALADPGSVARILRILLDNALRVAPRGSDVRVVVSAEPQPTLSVTDLGPGVAPEERALIFDRFKRGRETGGEAGFGLGLAIGRELAQRMGGALILADTEGTGATFTLTLRPAQAPSPDQPVTTVGV